MKIHKFLCCVSAIVFFVEVYILIRRKLWAIYESDNIEFISLFDPDTALRNLLFAAAIFILNLLLYWNKKKKL